MNKPRPLCPDATDALRSAILQAPDTPPAERTADQASRAATIVGLMLENNRTRRKGTLAALLASCASFLWGPVELATPRPVLQVLFQHWLAVLLTAALLVTGVGVVLGSPVTRNAGFKGIGITILFTLLSLFRPRRLGRRPPTNAVQPDRPEKKTPVELASVATATLKAAITNAPMAPARPASARNAARSLTIFGAMAEEYGNRHGGVRKPGHALNLAGRFSQVLVELAVPGSLAALWFRHFIRILWAAALVVVVFAFAPFGGPPKNSAAVVVFLVAFVHLAVLGLRRWMKA